MKLTLFGKDLEINTQDCSLNGNEGEYRKPFINLYVKVDKSCPFNCKFCTFRCVENKKFNVSKFIHVLTELQSKIQIGKVSFTGGEPLMNPDLLYMLLFSVKQYDPSTFTVVSTTGYNFQTDFPIELVDSLAISRHHYLQDKLDESFNTSRKHDFWRIFNLVHNKNKIHVSCNIVKGFIDTPTEIYNFLKFYATSFDIRNFGFVSLMPVNEYAQNSRIESTTLLDSTPLTKKAHCWNRREGNIVVCQCNNYTTTLHTESGVVEVDSYARSTLKQNQESNKTLVFDGEHLTIGFTGAKLI